MPRKMHSHFQSPSPLFNLKTLSAAVISALLMTSAGAAGLGKLTVLSSLGQPLRAEIELTSVSKEEAGALTAKLASSDAFKQANIDFNPALMSLRFTIDQRAGRQFIRITSTQAVNEPFVDMLLELGGPNGRLIREYTFLLDPADLRSTQTAQTAPPSIPDYSAANSTQAAGVRPTPDTRPQPVARAARPTAPAQSPASQSDADAGEYRVKNGDSLAKIANRIKPSGVSLDQMLVALYRSNPDAFVGQNMNRLRAGEILSLPSEESARSVNSAEARQVVIAQSADFRNYRSKLAAQVAGSNSAKSLEARQGASGRITAQVEEPSTPANESQDKLRLSRANPATNNGSGQAAGGTATEDRIANEKAVAEANARVKELEKNISELQKILELKNRNLAEQQKQAETKPSTTASAAGAAIAPVAPLASAAPVSPASPTPAAPSNTSTAEKAVEPKANPTDTPSSAPVANTVPPVAASPAPATAKPKQVVAPPPEERSFVDDLLDNPLLLPGAGLLLAALAGLGIYSARRKKQQKNFDENSVITDSSLKANSLFGSTGGQSVDTNNSVFNSNFTASANQLDSNEVDPVAEADVYIAYGRDAQAEEILKEALRTQPERNAVRVKLLEIYSNRKDLRAFEVMATELYGLTKGQGDEWSQAASLGAAIDPSNPLYASGKVAKDAQIKSDEQTGLGQASKDSGAPALAAGSAFQAIGDIEAETSYFSNTIASKPSPKNTDLADIPVLESARDETDAPRVSNDIDFDFDKPDSLEVPNTIPRPMPSEPSVDLSSIDFDFLDEPKVAADKPADAPPIEPMADLDLGGISPAEEKESAQTRVDESTESPSLNIDLPDLDVPPGAESRKQAPASPADPLDFDLSGINLELDPVDADSRQELNLDMHDGFDASGVGSSSNDAEMATKLDLAIAYQEIGDKEGARELLDEVLKGGNAEQSEKARSLLVELA
jgi:pilus assembly protein FimV